MLTATDVVAHRITVQQLDRPVGEHRAVDAAILDLGLQDTGQDAASWALVNRGVPVAGPAALAADPALVLVWTLRGAPHFYRRSELPDVWVAVSPFSEADAARRVIGAARPLQEAGIPVLDGLAEIAERMRRLVDGPVVKGDVSSRLTAVLDPPYVRDCVPCGAVHVWELPFRFGALGAGLELEPGTSPPVLRPVPGWPEQRPGPAPDPTAAPGHLQVIRAYLRFLGPATPAEVAAFLDAPAAEVKAHWPADAVEVTVAGRRAWALGELSEASVDPALLRLLSPYDPLLQGKDRQLLVSDRDHAKQLWPSIGRPGAVLSGTEIIGSWRPRAAARKLTVRLDCWVPISAGLRSRVEEQGAALAAHRGLGFAGVVLE